MCEDPELGSLRFVMPDWVEGQGKASGAATGHVTLTLT